MERRILRIFVWDSGILCVKQSKLWLIRRCIMDKKITSNYILNLIYQCLNVLSPLVTAPYISRVLNADGVGIYSYTVTIACTFSFFASLGASSYGQKMIAGARGDIRSRSAIFWELAALRVFTTVIVAIAYLIFSFCYQTYTIYLLQQSFCVFTVMLDLSWFFQGIEEFKTVTIRNAIVKFLTISLIFLLVKDPSHVSRYILINSLSGIVSALTFFPFLRGKVVWVPLRDWKLKRHWRGIIQFFIPLIATQIYGETDKLMLGAMVADIAESGYYEQARKIINILIAVLTSINTVMFPRIAYLDAKHEQSQIEQLHKETFRVILLLLIPMIVGLWCVADNFVLWFLGAQFQKVAELLRFSGLLLIFMSIGNFVGMQYLSPMGKQNEMSVIYLCAAGINLVLNAFLIAAFRSVGAIVASVVAEMFSCCAQVYLLKKSEYNFKMSKGLHKYILAAAAMACVILQMNYILQLEGVIATVLDVGVGAAVYLAALIVLREETVRTLIRKKREQ